MKNRVTVRKEVMDLYKEEKNQLYAQFSKLACRVSFTMDTWTSIQNKSYLCVTAYWIEIIGICKKKDYQLYACRR
jgi:hypothetical protein